MGWPADIMRTINLEVLSQGRKEAAQPYLEDSLERIKIAH